MSKKDVKFDENQACLIPSYVSVIRCFTAARALTNVLPQQSKQTFQEIFLELNSPVVWNPDSIIWVVVVASNGFHFVVSQNPEISKN
jgi:hypothetical protein